MFRLLESIRAAQAGRRQAAPTVWQMEPRSAHIAQPLFLKPDKRSRSLMAVHKGNSLNLILFKY